MYAWRQSQSCPEHMSIITTMTDREQFVVLYIAAPIASLILIVIIIVLFKVLRKKSRPGKSSPNPSRRDISSVGRLQNKNMRQRPPKESNIALNRELSNIGSSRDGSVQSDCEDPTSIEPSTIQNNEATPLLDAYEASELIKEEEGVDNDDSDKVLLQVFESVLIEGIVLILHTIKGPKQVKLFLSDNEVRWKSIKSKINRKTYKLNLSEIVTVEAGKTTENFQRKTALAAMDDNCFSLVTSRYSVDLEASSKVERDALLYGFSYKIQNLWHSSNF
eukprot:gene10910-22773_t